MPIEKKHIINGSTFIFAVLVSNFFNFLFNAVLGRWLSFENFGLITLVITFYYVSGIATNALAATINFTVSKLIGDGNTEKASFAFLNILKKSMFASLIIAIVWVVLTPLLMMFFQVNSPWPFLAFAPIIILSTYEYDVTGYFQGQLKFAKAGAILVIEPVAKLIAGILLTVLGFSAVAYFSLPISLLVGAIVGWIVLRRDENQRKKIKLPKIKFPTLFFTNALTVGIGGTIFFSVDIILVRHFFSSNLSGQYALISLIGKMMFFFSIIFNAFTLSVVARTHDKNKLNRLFLTLISATSALTFTGLVIIGLLGNLIVPILFGNKVMGILYLLPLYTLGIALYSIASVIVSFHLSRQQYIFTYYPIFAGLFFCLLTLLRHSSLFDITSNIALTSFLLLISLIFLHLLYQRKDLQYV